MSTWLNRLMGPGGTDSGRSPASLEEGGGAGEDPETDVRRVDFTLEALNGDAFVEWRGARESTLPVHLNDLDVNSTASVYVKMDSEILAFFRARSVTISMMQMRHVTWAVFSVMQLKWYSEVRYLEANFTAAKMRLQDADPKTEDLDPRREASDLFRGYLAHVDLIRNLNLPALLLHLEQLCAKLAATSQSVNNVHGHAAFLHHEVHGRLNSWQTERGALPDSPPDAAPPPPAPAAAAPPPPADGPSTSEFVAAPEVTPGRPAAPKKIGSEHPGVSDKLQHRATTDAAASSPSVGMPSPAVHHVSQAYSSGRRVHGPLRNPFGTAGKKGKKKDGSSKNE